MKAIIVFTETGPFLVLTTYQSPSDPNFIEKLHTKGINKFIIRELPVEKVKYRYGDQFSVIQQDLTQPDDFRVLDFNGHSVFYRFSFSEMGNPFYHEPH